MSGPPNRVPISPRLALIKRSARSTTDYPRVTSSTHSLKRISDGGIQPARQPTINPTPNSTITRRELMAPNQITRIKLNQPRRGRGESENLPTQSYSQPKPEPYRIRPELLSASSFLYTLRTVWATFLAFGARGSKVGSRAGRFWWETAKSASESLATVPGSALRRGLSENQSPHSSYLPAYRYKGGE